MGDNQDKQVLKISTEYQKIMGLAYLEKDGSVGIVDRTIGGTDPANAAKRPIVFIAIGHPEQIPKSTPPGAVIYEVKPGPDGHVDTSGHYVTYAWYYKEKYPKAKKKKKKKEPPQPDTLQDVFAGRKGKFNPPPHNVTRAISPTAFANYNLSATADVTNVTNAMKARRKGYITEDIETALDADGNPKTKASQLWGFEFMYNPEKFGHSISNASFELGNAEDTAVNLAGAQQLSLNLVINRMVDMPSLKTYWLENVEKVVPFTGQAPDYPRPLLVEDIEGLIKRGTEYDLEFLYRVLNGDPQLGPTATIPTSDFGYATQVPVWLTIHENFRYKVSITGITVNHIMFTEDMVPVVTDVNINMIRIPMPVYTTDDVSSSDFLYDRLTTKDGSGEIISRAPTYGVPADTSTGDRS